MPWVKMVPNYPCRNMEQVVVRQALPHCCPSWDGMACSATRRQASRWIHVWHCEDLVGITPKYRSGRCRKLNAFIPTVHFVQCFKPFTKGGEATLQQRGQQKISVWLKIFDRQLDYLVVRRTCTRLLSTRLGYPSLVQLLLGKVEETP